MTLTVSALFQSFRKIFLRLRWKFGGGGKLSSGAEKVKGGGGGGFCIPGPNERIRGGSRFFFVGLFYCQHFKGLLPKTFFQRNFSQFLFEQN